MEFKISLLGNRLFFYFLISHLMRVITVHDKKSTSSLMKITNCWERSRSSRDPISILLVLIPILITRLLEKFTFITREHKTTKTGNFWRFDADVSRVFCADSVMETIWEIRVGLRIPRTRVRFDKIRFPYRFFDSGTGVVFDSWLRPIPRTVTSQNSRFDLWLKPYDADASRTIDFQGPY